MKYLILIKPKHTKGTKEFYLDGIILDGDKELLTEKLTNIDFAMSLGIDESVFFEPFELVEAASVDFPEIVRGTNNA